jgi:hypothetical protein
VKGRNSTVVKTLSKSVFKSKEHQLTYIAHKETLLALNRHATVRASSRLTGSPRFYTLFSEFIQALRDAGYVSDYLENGASSRLATSYWAFIGCEKDEVKAVDK